MLEPVSLASQEFRSILDKPCPERPESVNGSVFGNAKPPKAPYLRFRCHQGA